MLYSQSLPLKVADTATVTTAPSAAPWLQGPAQTAAVQFSGGGLGSSLAKTFDTIYGDTGKRYAFEQTLCFTVPRTMQQLYRNKDITGTVNKMAAWEMLIRDLMADFLDTFAPGLLAYGVISKVLDKRHGAITHRMMGQDGLAYYAHVARTAESSRDFLALMDDRLNAAIQGNGGKPLASHLSLQAIVPRVAEQSKAHREKLAQLSWPKRVWANMRQTNPGHALADTMSHEWVNATGLTTHDLELPVLKSAHSAGKASVPPLNVTFSELMLDMGTIHGRMASDVSSQVAKAGAGAHWGEATANLLEKTRRLSKHHMWANAAALVASLSMPFAIRLITKAVYGKDIYPGSKALQDHYQKDAAELKTQADNRHHAFASQPFASQMANHAAATPEEEGKFEWFPYLKKDWSEGKRLHTAISGAFFGILGAAVLRNRFWGAPAVRKFGRKLNPFKWADIIKVYQFQRGFPWTTLAQMELTYGLLCGFRLLSARNESEWQETALRDALLGWPTLTYGFEFVQKQLAKLMNGSLVEKIGAQAGHALDKTTPLLRDAAGDIRPQDHLTEGMVKNLTGITGDALKKAVKTAHNTRRGLTVVSSLISIALLSWLEPKWGIQLTTNLEAAKHRKALEKDAKPILTRTAQPLPTLSSPDVQSWSAHPEAISFPGQVNVNQQRYLQAAFGQ